jgi:transcriptional regulator with AAA-type ATPase domain/tetratricopeptide (TPR) repeat protein
MSGLDLLIGNSAGMVALRAQVERLLARPNPAGRLPPVLLLGETGTGKGLLVRIMHQVSVRRDKPLIEINCAAIPENLVESELFGFERGAFTDARQAKPGLFQAAHRGVLFLDEVGALPRSVQAKLLTALEQREVRRLGSTRGEPVDAWIVSATNEDLAAGIGRGEFRLDLYHRISAVSLRMPPLRERGGDVLVLAGHFLERIATDYGVRPKRLTAAAHDALLAHAWPGNVREMANRMERAVLLADGEEISPQLLELSPPGRRRETGGREGDTSPDIDRETIRDALEATQWNLSRAAARLRLPRNTLRYRIERLGLRPGEAVATRPRADAPAPAPAVEAATPRLRWERRWVTGVLVGLEPPPSVSAFHLAPLLDDLVRKIEGFGGQLEELHPLGFIALFGREPMEDAPVRGALAAQAVLKTVESAQDLGGGRVGVTVALHVAESLIARGAPTGGMDLEDRRRFRRALESSAPTPGAIVTSVEAAPFLERRFVLEPLVELPLRGYRLVGPSRSSFAVGHRAPSPFVARERELALLDDLLGEMEGGRGQIIGVVGEPGVGKSRLLHEFRQGVGRERVTYLEARCAAYGSHVPYFPIVQLLRGAFAFTEADEPAGIASKLREGVHGLGLPTESVAPYLLHLLGVRADASGEPAALTPEAARNRTLDALRQVIIAASQQRPMIIAIEDLQWIDATSADSLMALAESAAACRVLMLTAYRQGYQPSWLGRSYATQVVLRRLSPADSLKIVESIAPAGVVSADVADALVAKAEGIPFFLEELVRSVSDRPGGATLAGIPGTVQGVISARLDRLPIADRHLLEAAAVLGKEGFVSLLREVSGLPDPEFLASFTCLRVAEFLRETRAVPLPQYAFTHGLTQEVAYENLSAQSRRALHGAAAAAVEKLMPQTADRMPELLAGHLTEAGLVVRAIGHWHRAGRHAIQRSANAEAIVHLTRALELLETQPDGALRAQQELTLQLSLMTALTATHGYAAPEVELMLARARALVEGLEESPETFLVRWNLWRFYVSRAEFRAAEELTVRLLGAAERGGDVTATLNVRFAAGVTKFYLGEFEPARAYLQGALRLHDEAPNPQQIHMYGQDLGIASRGFLAWDLAVMGDLDAAAEEAALALDRARTLGHPFSLALVLLAVGEVHQLRRDALIVESVGRELLDLSREHSFRFFTAFGLMFSGWARAAAGNPHDGLTMMREGADLFRLVGQRVGLAHRAHLAEVLVACGSLDEGLAVVTEALQQSEATGEAAFVAELHRLRAEALRRQGRPEEAEAGMRDALRIASRQGAWCFALRAASDLVRLGVERGSPTTSDLATLSAIVNRLSPSLHSSDVKVARALLLGGRP